MVSQPSFYFDVLYPLQNHVVAAINKADTDFYLTGGTAASRGYLNHRFSDDLDYFVNDDNRFGLWVERVIQALNRELDSSSSGRNFHSPTAQVGRESIIGQIEQL